MWFYQEYDIYSIRWELTKCQSEINWHFYASLSGNFVGCLQAAGTWELDHFSSPTETRTCALADCCKPLCSLSTLKPTYHMSRLINDISWCHTVSQMYCIDTVMCHMVQVSWYLHGYQYIYIYIYIYTSALVLRGSVRGRVNTWRPAADFTNIVWL